MPTVHLTFSKASLRRLHEISRHPLVSRGVRTIKICLPLYNAAFTDFTRFSSHFTPELKAVAEGKMEWNYAAASSYWHHPPTEDDLQAPKQGEDLRGRVWRAHQQFLALFGEQESCLNSNTFYQSFAIAIRRMGRVSHLDFDDGTYPERVEQETNYRQRRDARPITGAAARSGDPGSRRLFFFHMFQPFPGYFANQLRLEPPVYHGMIRLVGAAQTAGLFPRIKSINISLSSLSSLGRTPEHLRSDSPKFEPA